MTSAARGGGAPATRLAAQSMRAATSAPGRPVPALRAQPGGARWPAAVAAATSAPSMPALTAAATAAAPASAMDVLWVTRLAC